MLITPPVSSRRMAARLLFAAGSVLAWANTADARAASAVAAHVNPEHARAGDRCEAAVADTIRRMRGRAAREVEFIGAQRDVGAMPRQDIGVKGEGRYRAESGGTVRFTYSCAFNLRTEKTSGVVFREIGSGPGATASASDAVDLTRFTPDACESATAAALKRKYPRAQGIAFDPATRQLQAVPDGRTRLQARGAYVRAPGMPAMPFDFRCDVETAGGKVVGLQTHD